jgi:hypothetical protein
MGRVRSGQASRCRPSSFHSSLTLVYSVNDEFPSPPRGILDPRRSARGRPWRASVFGSDFSGIQLIIAMFFAVFTAVQVIAWRRG